MNFKEIISYGDIVCENDSLGMVIVWDGKNKFQVFDVWNLDNVLEVDSFTCHTKNLNSAKMAAENYFDELFQEVAAA